MLISDLEKRLSILRGRFGDVPIVLWDKDTESYYSMSEENLEAQIMSDETVRVSVGVNEWDDPQEDEPLVRPILCD